MTSQELNNIWNYYLSLEQDISNTSRYIEPDGQEDVHSFEFAKLLILACTEVESVFKAICFKISGEQPPADIGKYKEMILGHYPKIIEASVTVNRLGKEIKPFQEWSKGPLSWWGAYQEVKHMTTHLHWTMNQTLPVFLSEIPSCLKVRLFLLRSCRHDIRNNSGHQGPLL